MVPETQFNDQSADVYDMQCDGVAPEVMEQFRQMGMQGVSPVEHSMFLSSYTFTYLQVF